MRYCYSFASLRILDIEFSESGDIEGTGREHEAVAVSDCQGDGRATRQNAGNVSAHRTEVSLYLHHEGSFCTLQVSGCFRSFPFCQ